MVEKFSQIAITVTFRQHNRWSTRYNQTMDQNIKSTDWLDQAVARYQESIKQKKKVKLFTATVDDQIVELTADMAKEDQMNITLMVLQNLKSWVAASTTSDKTIAEAYEPLRITVKGCAGSGKSFLIKAIANTVRSMFDDQDVVQISAPTGAAANNVGGETIHRKFAINPHNPNKELSRSAMERLKQTKRRALVEIFDERSMLTCPIVGAAERNTAITTHGGSHDDEDWGGVPIIIWFGDDYQLPPPTNKEKGAFDLMDSRTSYSQQKLSNASFGAQVMWDMSRVCVELRTTKRQKADQAPFKQTLERLRLGEAHSDDAKFLMDLYLPNMATTEVQQILNKESVMHLFATKAPRDEFNLTKLADLATSTNPAALVTTIWKSTKHMQKRTMLQHFDDPPANAVLICRGSVVRLTGRNVEPDWGLYNNAIGTIVEIVFRPGQDPNNGDQPAYVIVRFPSYCGPTWCDNDPCCVPVPMFERRCKKGCCTVKFCPLDLSFGMTAHTFQGQSAGPVDHGQPKNAVDCIIYEPGTNRFEGSNPGLLYMGVSRATTAGTGQLDSAVYFTGPNMNRHRILNLTKQRDGTTFYKKVQLRNAWIQRLNENTTNVEFTTEERKELLQWARTYKMTTEELEKNLSKRAWRKNLKKTNI